MPTLKNGGHFVADAAISSGTLRSADLLRSFADCYEALNPTNGAEMARTAHRIARNLDNLDISPKPWIDDVHEDAAEMIDALQAEINYCLGQANQPYYFGTTEGDGACFGIWRVDDED
jgi:hypothetical protein